MAEKSHPETGLAEVIRFLRSGARPDATGERDDAVNLMIREIQQNPAGAITARLWSALIRQSLLQTILAPRFPQDSDAALAGQTVGDLMSPAPWTARPDQTLSELVNRLFLAHAITFAPVVEDAAVLGYVDLHMVHRINRENWTNATVDDVIESVGPDNKVAPDLPGDELFRHILQTGRRKFLVIDGNALVGVVTLADLVSYPGISRQLQQSPSPRS
jgi:CBS domain-containing protein